MKTLDQFEIEERRTAYRAWFRRQAAVLGFYGLPRSSQDEVATLLRRAFLAGAEWQREQHEPVRVGGRD